MKRPCGMPYCNNEASYRVPREHFPSPEFVCGLHSTSDDIPLDTDLDPRLRLRVVR